MAEEHIIEIDIQKITESPYQGRLINLEPPVKDVDKLKRLAESIDQNGLLVPIVLRPQENGMYELIDGHRRLEAHKLLHRETIPAIVRPYDDKMTQVFSIVGNLERENLSQVELAIAYEKILNAGIYKNQKELSQALGKDQSYIGDMLNILKLDKRIIQDLSSNNSIKDVRLLRLLRKCETTNSEGKSDMQWQLYQRVLSEKLTRQQVLAIVRGETQKSTERRSIKQWGKKIDIKLNFDDLSKSDKALLKEIIDNKVEEIFNEFERKKAKKNGTGPEE